MADRYFISSVSKDVLHVGSTNGQLRVEKTAIDTLLFNGMLSTMTKSMT